MSLSLISFFAVSLIIYAEALKCYNCNNCWKFDKSQAIDCRPSNDVCMKVVHQTGVILRDCGFTSICEKYRNQTRKYKEVMCCTTNECNFSPSNTSHFGIIYTPAFLILLHLYHFF